MTAQTQADCSAISLCTAAVPVQIAIGPGRLANGFAEKLADASFNLAFQAWKLTVLGHLGTNSPSRYSQVKAFSVLDYPV